MSSISTLKNPPNNPAYSNSLTGGAFPVIKQINGGLSGITIAGGGGGGINGATFMNLAGTYSELSPFVKKYEVHELTEDLLTLSVVWWELRQIHPMNNGVARLLDKILFTSVADNHRIMSAAIRDYYSKKIMVWNLKGIPLTPFRTVLNSFIHSTTKTYTENMFGLAYWLPEFYQYDLAMDSIRSECTSSPNAIGTYVIEDTFTPIKIIIKKNKTRLVSEYWMKNQSNNAVVLKLDPKNPLLSFWEKVYNSNQPFVLRGDIKIKQADGFNFFEMGRSWELVNR
jgi:hypothetical protein